MLTTIIVIGWLTATAMLALGCVLLVDWIADNNASRQAAQNTASWGSYLEALRREHQDHQC